MPYYFWGGGGGGGGGGRGKEMMCVHAFAGICLAYTVLYYDIVHVCHNDVQHKV